MQSLKASLFAVLTGALVGGTVALVGTAGPSAEAADKAVHNHWRYHDGHWGYWYEPDQRWYYTDGANWYYSGGDQNGWNVYRFDKKYGREEFERGDYRLPDEGAKIVVPRHQYYRDRK